MTPLPNQSLQSCYPKALAIPAMFCMLGLFRRGLVLRAEAYDSQGFSQPHTKWHDLQGKCFNGNFRIHIKWR